MIKPSHRRLSGGDCVNAKSANGADKDPVTLADIPLNRKIRVTISEKPPKYFCFDRHVLFGTGADTSTDYIFYSSMRNPFTGQDFTKKEIIEILSQVRKGVFYYSKEHGAYAVPIFLYQFIQENFTPAERDTYLAPLITGNQDQMARFHSQNE